VKILIIYDKDFFDPDLLENFDELFEFINFKIFIEFIELKEAKQVLTYSKLSGNVKMLSFESYEKFDKVLIKNSNLNSREFNKIDQLVIFTPNTEYYFVTNGLIYDYPLMINGDKYRDLGMLFEAYFMFNIGLLFGSYIDNCQHTETKFKKLDISKIEGLDL
jgi:hypothetical protein